MNKMKKLIAAAAAMTLSAPLFAADYSIDELAAKGATVVRVQQVLANCERGLPFVLFKDQAGALIKLDELAHIDDLMDAHGITYKGRYSNLHVVLADEAIVTRDGRTEVVELRQGLNGTVVRLDGELQVSRNFVGAKGDLSRSNDILASAKRVANKG